MIQNSVANRRECEKGGGMERLEQQHDSVIEVVLILVKPTLRGLSARTGFGRQQIERDTIRG